MRVQLPSEPPHLNPLADSLEVVDQVTRGLVYETLVECVGGRAAPALADSWTWSPDGMRLELHLRPEVNWHDGRSLNAIDAQATIEASLRSTSRLAAARASLADVAAVDVMADRRVRLRLARPSTIVLRGLCDLPIVPERLIRGSSVERARLGKQPIGTGPFRFAVWEPGSQIRLEANPRPWRQPPRVEEIVFEIDADTGSSLRKLRRGELDLMPRLPEIHHPEQVTRGGAGAAAAGAAFRRVPVQLRGPESPPPGAAGSARAPGAGSPVESAAPGRRPAPRPGATDRHHGTLAARARPVLAAGGRAVAGRGRLEGQRRRPLPRAGRPAAGAGAGSRARRQREQAAQRFALDAARAGVRVQLQPVDPGQLRDRLRAGEFDLALLSWRGRPDEDLRPLFGQGGAFNHGAFASASVQALLDQIANAPDVEAATGPPDDAQAALASALASERPALFLFQHQQVTVASTAVHGLCHDGVDLDLRGVWLAP